MKKKVLALLLAAMMSLSLVACGGGGGRVSSEPVSAIADDSEMSGTIKLQLIEYTVAPQQDTATGKDLEGYEAFFEREFGAKYPNVKWSIEEIPWDNSQQKGQVSLSTGEVDLANTGAYASQYWYGGILRKIDDLLAADTEFDPLEVYANGIWENSFSIQSYEKDARFGLPAVMGQMYTIYDSQIFEDFGAEPLPEKPTPEDIIEAAKTCTGVNPRTGQQNYGLHFLANRSTDVFAFVALTYHTGATGGEGSIGKPGEIKWDLNNDKMKKAFEYIGEYVKYTGPGFLQNQGNENFGKVVDLEPGVENTTAIVLDSATASIWARYLRDGKTDTTELDRFKAVYNVGPNGIGWVAVDPIVMSAKVKDENLQAAWAAMKFLTNHETQVYEFEQIRNAPTLKDTSFIPEEHEGMKIAMDIANNCQYTLIDEANPFFVSNIVPAVQSYMSAIKEGQSPNLDEILSTLQTQAEEWSAQQAQASK